MKTSTSTVPPELNALCSAQINPDDATPMVRQLLAVKQQYTGIILFYRMGDFYETFFEDAIITARALDITLTGREAGKLGRIPMAGVPAKAVDGYVQKLLEKNFKVALCDQMEDPANAKGLVERRVTRVMSPGTIADQQFLNPNQNNFLAAAFYNEKLSLWGFAYCDVTTGTFLTTQLTTEQFFNELDRVDPSELLVLGRRQKGVVVDEWVPDVTAMISDRYRCTALKPDAYDSHRTYSTITRWFRLSTLESLGLEEMPVAVCAAGAILGYLEASYVEAARPLFDTIRLYHVSTRMQMNASTRRHLELVQTLKDNKLEGSLLWILDWTLTPMGARLLRQWMLSPSVELMEIESRLDAVELLTNATDTRYRLRELLPAIYDIERLAMKVQNQSALPKDLIALKRSCQVLPLIADALQGLNVFYLERLHHIPPAIDDFTRQISQSLKDSPPLTIKEGGIFALGYHAQLDELRALIETQEQWLTEYEARERERSGIKTLKVGMNGAFGYFIEISKAMASQAPGHYQRRQTLTNAERYITPELKNHEEQVFDAQNRLYGLEYELFIALRSQLAPLGSILKEISGRVALLDVLQSFAAVTVENDYVRPQIDSGLTLSLSEARHPVVEKMLPLGAFVANNCRLSAAYPDNMADESNPDAQLMIITGPNMAGKSTFMRQTALIVVMAQIGCFVPASCARIGLVDQLFTRIGAVDDLGRAQSTFMVEMTETAHILNCATPHSLVLLDEVGRGTSTYDGVSIAWSVAEYLVNNIGCRALFATHYHELNTMEALSPRIQNYRVLVSETEGHVEFLHRVAPGAAQKSYGIQVGRMAGLPSAVIQKAERLLNAMQEKAFTVTDKKRQISLLKTAQQDQLTLFASSGAESE